MKKFSSYLAIALSCLLISPFFFLKNVTANASSFMGEIMNEEFLGDGFSADNWRLVEELDDNGEAIPGDISITESDNYVNVMGPSYDLGTAVYIDQEIKVASATGKLIIEFDIVNTENYSSMFSIVTGMQKGEEGVVLTDERRSQMIMTGPGGNFLNVQHYGLPGDYSAYDPFDIYVGSTNFGGFCHDDVGGYAKIGYRVRMVYGNDGSLYTYRYKINEDGSYGEEEERLYVPNGMIVNGHSGYVGFFFWYETLGVNIQNFRIATKKSASSEEVTVFEDTCKGTSLKEEWKTINGNARVSMQGFPRSVLFNNPNDNNYLVSAGSKNITYDAVYDEYIKMTFGLRIDQLTGVRKFGLAFGLLSSSETPESEDVNYIYFTPSETSGKIELGISKTVNGAPVYSNLYEIDASLILGKDLNVEIIPYVNGKVDVVLNGKSYTFQMDGYKIILDKRFSFIACGGDSEGADTVIASVSKIHITNRYDSVPDDIVDMAIGFEGKDENGNPYYDKTLYSFGGGTGYAQGDLNAGVFIEDGVLKFRNAGHNSYFSPMKPFGDFMLQMDIVDIAREDLLTESGSIFRPAMRSWIGITFGLPSGGSPYPSGYMLYITPTYVEDEAGKIVPADTPSPFVLLGPGEVALGSGVLRHNIVDKELDGKSIVVRLIVDGGELRFSYYVKGEESITMLDQPVFTYDNNGYGLGHNGYIGITCTSNSEAYMAGDFSIDNFVIKSLERNVNITNDKDKPVNTPVEEEKNPTDEKPKYDFVEDNGSGCGSSIGASAVLTVLTAGAAITLFRKKD